MKVEAFESRALKVALVGLESPHNTDLLILNGLLPLFIPEIVQK